MKILYVGFVQGFENAARFYMVSHKLVNGFTRNGHNVYMFNDRDYARASNIWKSSRAGRVKVNAKLIEVCRDFAPDLLVLSNCDRITNDTVRTMRAMLPAMRVIYVNVDPLHAPNNVAKIVNRMDVADGAFITTAGDSLKQFSRPDAFVCFMPNPIDDSIETGMAFAGENSSDVFFAGGFVRDFPDVRLALLENLSARLTDLTLDIHLADSSAMWGQRYIDAITRSKVGLCLNKTDDYYLYSSDRMAQYIGNGLLVMIHRASGFQDLFEEGDIGLYGDINELEDQIRYYAVHDDVRRKAAERGWRRAHAIFACRRITQFMVEKTFDIPLNQDYIWPTISH